MRISNELDLDRELRKLWAHVCARAGQQWLRVAAKDYLLSLKGVEHEENFLPAANKGDLQFDPVVHVDDINTLSFFDALRDLVLSEKRQLFFATANTRIANLFARKFDFLQGSAFKQFVFER